MQTKFTPLVKVKKNTLQQCEQQLHQCRINLQNAQLSLQEAHEELLKLPSPTSGSISEFSSNRYIIQTQRAQINEKIEWVTFANKSLEDAQKVYEEAHIEFEKYKYLESEEVKKALKEAKVKESRDLDEVALQTFMNKRF